jgi:putative transposase
MGLALSTYYYKPKTSEKVKAMRDADLRDKIEAIHLKFPTYGYRRIAKTLLREGLRVNTKRIRRVMQENSLFPTLKKAFRISTTDSNHNYLIHPNRLPGMKLTAVNQVWVADITYIRILTGFVYLAAVMDLYSRKIIGWGVSMKINAELCLDALKMAIEDRKPSKGCIHHSDRGVQYACYDYVDTLKEHEFQISMSRKGNPYDNAFMESFMKTLKTDEVYLWEYESMKDVIERLPIFIEEVYNKKRLHSSLGYRPPEEFESVVEKMKTKDRPLLEL